MTGDRPLDVRELLAERAGATPDAPALETPGRRPLSYAGLERNVALVLGGLRAAGVRPGDRVAVALPDGPEMAVALLAATAAGVCAPLNPRCGLQDGERHLAALRATWLLAQAGVDAPLRGAAAACGVRVLDLALDAQSDDGLYRLLPGGGAEPSPPSAAEPDDVVVALPTSGTTGTPKVVPLTRRNLGRAIGSVCRALALGPADACLVLMPQFHIGGLVDLLLAPLASGGRVVCARGFDAAEFGGWLERLRPTWFQAVPATLAAMLAQAERAGLREHRSSLRFIRAGASALSPRMLGELEDLFKVPVLQIYGMTEAAPLIATPPLPPGRRKPSSVGRPAGPEVAVVDADGNAVPARSVGEIVIRGDNVTRGYENAPEANARSFRGGWFHTGDLGWFDEDGDLFLTGRLSEVVNRGGEKVAPAEIDLVLQEHPSVAEAAAYPVPHPELGEDLAAAVVPRAGTSPTPEELRTFVAERLAPFKVPRTVLVVEAIPKGPTGKVQRALLHERLACSPAAAAAAAPPFEAPRSEIEAWLAEAWTDVLARERPGIHDDFFRCGGSSYGVVDLLARIEMKFALKLPLHSVSCYPTIAGLARLIAARETDPSGSRSSELDRAEKRPPCWLIGVPSPACMVGIPLGTSWDETPERDLYGMSIEELAAQYVGRIRGYQATGPYRLGGYSIGALLGLEVARQLRAQGCEVPLLLLVDPVDPEEPAALDARLSTRDRVLNRLVSWTLWPASRLLVGWHRPLRGVLRTVYASRVYRSAAQRYRPPAYPGPTLLYLRRRRFEGRAARWRSLCPGARVAMVDAPHHHAVAQAPWNEGWLRDLQRAVGEGAGNPTGGPGGPPVARK